MGQAEKGGNVDLKKSSQRERDVFIARAHG